MVPSRVVGGMAQSSLSSGMYTQRDRPSEVAGNSQLNSFGLSSNSIPGYARASVGPHLGDVTNVVSSGPSVGTSSLVTDANSGLSNGPHLRRSASANTEAYMRLPASPMSFSSNNISISGSSILDGSSTMHQNSNQDPGSQQNQQTLQHQGISSATSLPSSYMGQVQLPGGPKVANSFMQDPTTISQLQKKPRLDIKQEDVVQQQVLQQLLQRQDSMHLRNPNPQLQALIQQQRLRQQQQQQHQQQQQQLLQSMLPMQRAQSLQLQQQQQQQQQQLRQQLLQQGLQPSSGIKRPYDGGVCSRRLMQYLYHQRQRPADNTIAYWRKFVAEYYSPRAKKRWCLSLYDNVGHQSLGVFPQAAIDSWQCDICGSKSGKGFEATFEVLPRLNEFKYGGGIIDELLFLDLPRECRYPSGMMMLEYAKAVQESVYEHIRVVHEGQLRIIFTPDLKILHWEFCARRHEELLSRRLVAPQVNQLLQVALKCQSTISESGPDGVSQPDVQTNSAMVVTAGRQLARSLELQSLNDLGFPKRYVRCLQIAEVVNSMKDLMDFCKDQKVGSIEGLKKFPGNATAPKVQTQMQEIEKGGPQGLPADCNTPNQLTSMHPGITSPKNNNQHTTDRTGAFNGLAQPALVSSNYQNLPMRQNSMNATHNSVKQEPSSPFGTPNHPPPTPESSGILPGALKNSQVGAFSSGQLQQHAPNGNGLLQQNQSLSSLGSQALQQQMVQQYLQDISNKNNGAAVPPQSLSVQNPGHDLKSSSATTAVGNGPGNVAGHPTNGSNGFKADSESLAPVGNIGFSQKTSDLSEDLHLSDDMVQDIVHEFTENGFFDNDLDDDMNFSWKA